MRRRVESWHTAVTDPAVPVTLDGYGLPEEELAE